MVLVFCGGSGLKGLWLDVMRELRTVVVATNKSHSQDEDTDPLLTTTTDMTAVIAMSDDGGSSRAIMDCMGGLPVGDCRNVSVAIADAMLRVLEAEEDASSSSRDEVEQQQEHHIGNSTASPLLLQGVRQVVTLMSTRVHPDDDAIAQQDIHAALAELERWCLAGDGEVVDDVVTGSVLTPSSCASIARSGLVTFLAAVNLLVEGCDKGSDAVIPPRDDCPTSRRQAFVSRNASIGNLVLAGLVLQQLTKEENPSSAGTTTPTSAATDPMYQAMRIFLQDVLGVRYLSSYFHINVDVVPTLDYQHYNCNGSRGNVHISETASPSQSPRGVTKNVIPLPCAVLRCEWSDGNVVWGQRAISYAVDQQSTTSDPLITVKGEHLPTMRGNQQRHCEESVPQPTSLSLHWCRRDDAALLPHPLPLSASSDDVAASSSASLNMITIVPSLVAAKALRDATMKKDPLILLARGSLLTSTIAAAAPHLGTPVVLPTMTLQTTPQAVVSVTLMVNGWQDRETQSVDTFADVVSLVERLLPRCRVEGLWLPTMTTTVQPMVQHSIGSGAGALAPRSLLTMEHSWPSGDVPPHIHVKHCGLNSAAEALTFVASSLVDLERRDTNKYDDKFVASLIVGRMLTTQ